MSETAFYRLTIEFVCTIIKMVIFVKIGYTKSFYALGLLLLTFQILVYMFEYIVNTGDIVAFFMNTWAGVLGYLVLLVLFVRSIIYCDFILALIGCLLWVVQFVQVFKVNSEEPLTALLFCAAGILGILFIIVGLFVQMSAKKNNN